jgi:hypothetical protein
VFEVVGVVEEVQGLMHSKGLYSPNSGAKA